jgi:hypothetical protein
MRLLMFALLRAIDAQLSYAMAARTREYLDDVCGSHQHFCDLRIGCMVNEMGIAESLLLYYPANGLRPGQKKERKVLGILFSRDGCRRDSLDDLLNENREQGMRALVVLMASLAGASYDKIGMLQDPDEAQKYKDIKKELKERFEPVVSYFAEDETLGDTRAIERKLLVLHSFINRYMNDSREEIKFFYSRLGREVDRTLSAFVYSSEEREVRQRKDGFMDGLYDICHSHPRTKIGFDTAGLAERYKMSDSNMSLYTSTLSFVHTLRLNSSLIRRISSSGKPDAGKCHGKLKALFRKHGNSTRIDEACLEDWIKLINSFDGSNGAQHYSPSATSSLLPRTNLFNFFLVLKELFGIEGFYEVESLLLHEELRGKKEHDYEMTRLVGSAIDKIVAGIFEPYSPGDTVISSLRFEEFVDQHLCPISPSVLEVFGKAVLTFRLKYFKMYVMLECKEPGSTMSYRMNYTEGRAYQGAVEELSKSSLIVDRVCSRYAQFLGFTDTMHPVLRQVYRERSVECVLQYMGLGSSGTKALVLDALLPEENSPGVLEFKEKLLADIGDGIMRKLVSSEVSDPELEQAALFCSNLLLVNCFSRISHRCVELLGFKKKFATGVLRILSAMLERDMVDEFRTLVLALELQLTDILSLLFKSAERSSVSFSAVFREAIGKALDDGREGVLDRIFSLYEEIIGLHQGRAELIMGIHREKVGELGSEIARFLGRNGEYCSATFFLRKAMEYDRKELFLEMLKGAYLKAGSLRDYLWLSKKSLLCAERNEHAGLFMGFSTHLSSVFNPKEREGHKRDILREEVREFHCPAGIQSPTNVFWSLTYDKIFGELNFADSELRKDILILAKDIFSNCGRINHTTRRGEVLVFGNLSVMGCPVNSIVTPQLLESGTIFVFNGNLDSYSNPLRFYHLVLLKFLYPFQIYLNAGAAEATFKGSGGDEHGRLKKILKKLPVATVVRRTLILFGTVPGGDKRLLRLVNDKDVVQRMRNPKELVKATADARTGEEATLRYSLHQDGFMRRNSLKLIITSCVPAQGNSDPRGECLVLMPPVAGRDGGACGPYLRLNSPEGESISNDLRCCEGKYSCRRDELHLQN